VSLRYASLQLLLCALAVPAALAGDMDELKDKREAVFEFARRPVVTRRGDRITITFESKGFCDCTVAIEDPAGKIVRYLASGVLGQNAPAPFAKNSKEQTLVWDGKDEQGRYVDHKDRLTIRVSLGLRPRFERTLYWSPKKRQSKKPPLIAAAPEGVYVYDGGMSTDHVTLYDHKGNYLRTVYPFPAGKIGSVVGVDWHTHPHDGKSLPIKPNYLHSTMLTSGTSAPVPFLTWGPEQKRSYSEVARTAPDHRGNWGRAATAIAACRGQVALAYWHLNRLTGAGNASKLSLRGPKTGMVPALGSSHSKGHSRVGPGASLSARTASGSTSPDTSGRWTAAATPFTWWRA